MTVSDGARLPEFLGGGGRPPPLSRRPSRRRGTGHIPGEPGLWLFVLGDMTLFGLFFVGYTVALGRERPVFAAGAGALSTWSGLVNTLVLLTSSFCVVAALGALRAGRGLNARRLFTATAWLGTVFVVIKLAEYRHLVGGGSAPGTNLYFTYYFVLTGIHLSHVVIGIALICVCARLCGKASAGTGFAEGAGAYWHMVDALWMVLFPILYLVPVA